MRPTNLSPTFLLIFLTFKIGSAQTDLDSALLRTDKTESKWNFGAQLFQGLEFYRFNDNGNVYHGDSDYRLGLGLFTNYRWHQNHALQAETNLYAGNGIAVGVNFQYEYFFSNRWSIYGGLGLNYEFMESFSANELPEQRSLIPQAMIGIRYKASKWITLDLRYQRDLINRYDTDIETRFPAFVKSSSLNLGVQVRF
ncbi:MAG: outer membrane beta-barrel protein [Nonlabens sp.]